MKSNQSAKIAAWAAHHQKFECAHEHVELRRQTVRGGAVAYVEQCLLCGRRASNAISRQKALEATGGAEPAVFDESLLEAWEKERAESASQISSQFDRAAFFEEYAKYLSSPEWKEKRRKVIRRAAGVCEGCGEAAADEVHHLSYAHVGDEFLFELVAVCKSCHDCLHADEQLDEDAP